MNALAQILTSPKVKVDVARQVRVWSGTLRSDEDYEAAIQELLPFYTPPEDESAPATKEEKPESTEFKGTVKYHSATQNFAFSVNQPRFDVRDQLHTIKVGRRHTLLLWDTANEARHLRSWLSVVTTMSPLWSAVKRSQINFPMQRWRSSRSQDIVLLRTSRRSLRRWLQTGSKVKFCQH